MIIPIYYKGWYAPLKADRWNNKTVTIRRILAEGELRPRAVVAVDLFGLPADYYRIRRIWDKYSLILLEDGAQGFGGRIGDRNACSFGDISTKSFFSAKPLGCYGDGDAIFTDDDETARICRSIFSFMKECMAWNPDIVCLNYLDYQKNAGSIIRNAEKKLIMIDNADILLDDDTRKYLALDDKNQYFIIGRNPKNLLLRKKIFLILWAKSRGNRQYWGLRIICNAYNILNSRLSKELGTG